MMMAFELRVLRCTVNTNRRLPVKWISLCYHGSIGNSLLYHIVYMLGEAFPTQGRGQVFRSPGG